MRQIAAALGALIAFVALVVLPAPRASAEAPPGEGGWDRQWGMRLIGAEAAWDKGLMGEGVEIAVIDTGVHLSHQDLVDRIGPGRNYINPGEPPQDDYHDTAGRPRGHGTHVTGIAAAGYGNGGIVGVAPKAGIMPIKALRDDGSGSSSDVADAMRWAADNGAEVINLSLGEFDRSLFGPATQDAIDYVWSKGVIAVFAAGNDFVLPSGFRDHPALVVAAVNRNDEKSYFSSDVGNAMWALAAPGGPATVAAPVEERVFSTIWVDDDRNNTYDYMQGTSMAAPHVAGAAAILRAAGLSPQEAVDRLLATAKDLGAEGRDSTYGSGRLDVARATHDVGGNQPGPSSTTAPQGPPPPPPPPASTTEAPAPAPVSTSEAAPTTSAAPPSTAHQPTTLPALPTTATTADDTTDATVAIETERGGDSGRPWVPIGAATAALGATAAALALHRGRSRT